MKTYLTIFVSLFLCIPVFSQSIKESDVPAKVQDAFKAKLPNVTVTSWEKDTSMYVVSFTNKDNQKGISGYTEDGVWHNTKYIVPERELPSPIVMHIKQNFKDYKVKTAYLVQELGTNNYYFAVVKKEGVAQPSMELTYTLAGKFIKKAVPKVNPNAISTDNPTRLDTTNSVSNLETIDKKELPSPVSIYIKQNFDGYVIKEAATGNYNKGISYYVTVKKAGMKETHQLIFDINGKYIGTTDKPKPDDEP
ncbi:MAG: PepSY-like domain-containing protein [Bacteroidales bacterium]|jgi:hypothetical protein